MEDTRCNSSPPPPTHGMLSEREPGLPAGTSELNDIAGPLRMSVHRLKSSVSVASSNFSARITSLLFVARPGGGRGPPAARHGAERRAAVRRREGEPDR